MQRGVAVIANDLAPRFCIIVHCTEMEWPHWQQMKNNSEKSPCPSDASVQMNPSEEIKEVADILWKEPTSGHFSCHTIHCDYC